ncbi:MAG: AMP-binding protein [Candidatus Binatia bacterium]
MAYGLVANAESRPDHPALVCGTQRLTYGGLDRLVNRTAHALRDRGLAAGGRVALVLPNGAQFFAVTNAAAKLGALAVPINYRWRQGELAYVLADSGADVLVLDAAFLGEVEPALAAAGRPAREQVLVLGGAAGWASFEDAVAEASDTAPPGAITQSGYNIVIYTSGTTGRPKGVVHPHVDPKLGFEAQRALVEMWGFRPDDVHLMVGPAYHTMPSAYVAQHLFVGATSVLMPKFDAEECLRLIATERVTTSAMVPAHFIRILELPDAVRGRYDLSSLRKVLHAAAPCPTHVKRRIMQVFPPGCVWEFYGATEGPGTIIGPEEWLRKPGSVGRPWPGVTVRILDDEGHECPPGTVGTIYLSSRGGARFRYHNAEEKTASVFRGDFFTVGDMGHLDDDGYLFISDRKHDMVISGGVNIYPLEIENVLAAHPDVVDVAVVGVPDARWGETLVAVVQPRQASALTGAALQAWSRERMADYKVPRRVELVAELPRDPNGKVLKRFLRERLTPT